MLRDAKLFDDAVALLEEEPTMLDSVAQAQALDECAKKAFLLCVQDGMVAGSMDRSERQRCGRLIKLLKAETERAHYLRQYVASMPG